MDLKFMDSVKVVEGFYKGGMGYVEQEHIGSNEESRYYVEGTVLNGDNETHFSSWVNVSLLTKV